MTQQELLERARVWLAIPYPKNREEANRQELNTLYHAVTGRHADCSSCTNWLIRMAAKLTEYVASPESFTLQPTRTVTMATTSSKYRISKAAKENGAEIVVLNHNGTSEAINLNSMTDAQAERILKNKQFAHNVEVIKTKEGDAAPAKSTKSAPKAAAEAPAPAKAEPTAATGETGKE
ncbi:hypothetical protein [Rufibacter latericius]|uniref:Uncharacterized protein n=1 Tax=Rufibacter latericius TaxID=2487040 RepID=A0A3M9MN53_9BACT|nr:hypothetical protein [Rufibacter latericius]RNI26635.1 hypothetical protein EFB08_11495 [Rufibacter latericius]